MTANKLAFLLIPIALVLTGALVVYYVRKAKPSKQTRHMPHSPDSGIDQAEVVRSKGMGMADGGM